jgi:hypothetical protein
MELLADATLLVGQRLISIDDGCMPIFCPTRCASQTRMARYGHLPLYC